MLTPKPRVLADISNSPSVPLAKTHIIESDQNLLKVDIPHKNGIEDKKNTALTENSVTTNIPDGEKKRIKPKKGVSFAASEWSILNTGPRLRAWLIRCSYV
jgi:hypothetical protein